MGRRSRLWWLIAMSFVGCAARGEPPPDDPELQAEDSSEDSLPIHHDADPYQDPCVVGMMVELDGQAVWLPVPCVYWDHDEGDPPPDEALGNPALPVDDPGP